MALSIGQSGLRQKPVDRSVGRALTPADDLDHYHVESEAFEERTPIADQMIGVLELLLILVIAALSLAVFWVVALFFGIL
jgi:hypothetical protein